MYIRGPQNTAEQAGTLALPPGADRRMAKIQRATCNSVYAALNKTGTTSIDAIYSATALGCLEDTEKFLEEITGPSTSLRSPLPFMRSTHNTMAGQLALLLKVTGPNLTYSQSVFGFHAALLNAMLHLEEQPEHTVVAFAADERTELAATLASAIQPDAALGEGVASFILGGKARSGDVARITRVEQSVLSKDDLQAILKEDQVAFVLWSSFPQDAIGPAIPANIASERYDPLSGYHGAQTAQALDILCDRIASRSITGSCMIIDQVGGRFGIIGVEPC